MRLPVSALLLAAAIAARAQPPVPAPACSGARAQALDFWVGRWRVVDAKDGRLLGSNTVDKVLKGCALMENWREPDGGEGKSFFWFDARTQLWHQLWVEDDTRPVGGIKEKLMVSEPGAHAVRFQGTLLTPDDRVLLDRTTLEPLGDGRVRQTIEVSKDGGASWRVGFDGVYVREP